MMSTFILFATIETKCYKLKEFLKQKFNVFKFTALVRANDAFINYVVVNDDDGDMEPFTLRCVY